MSLCVHEGSRCNLVESKTRQKLSTSFFSPAFRAKAAPLFIYIFFSLQLSASISASQTSILRFFQTTLSLAKTHVREKSRKVSLLRVSCAHNRLFFSPSLWGAGCQLWRSSIVSWSSTCHHSVKMQRRGAVWCRTPSAGHWTRV